MKTIISNPNLSRMPQFLWSPRKWSISCSTLSTQSRGVFDSLVSGNSWNACMTCWINKVRSSRLRFPRPWISPLAPEAFTKIWVAISILSKNGILYGSYYMTHFCHEFWLEDFLVHGINRIIWRAECHPWIQIDQLVLPIYHSGQCRLDPIWASSVYRRSSLL